MKDKIKLPPPHKYFNRPSCVRPQIIEIITGDDGTLYYKCRTVEGEIKMYFADRYEYNFTPKVKLKVLPRNTKPSTSIYED